MPLVSRAGVVGRLRAREKKMVLTRTRRPVTGGV